MWIVRLAPNKPLESMQAIRFEAAGLRSSIRILY